MFIQRIKMKNPYAKGLKTQIPKIIPDKKKEKNLKSCKVWKADI